MRLLILKSLALLVTAVMAGNVQAAPVSGQGTWETTLQARDLNGDEIADAFYDTALGITWLANADAHQGPWQDSMTWAENLDVYGVTGWRLPTLANGYGNACNQPGAPDSSELQHMFFTTLGNSISCGGGVSALSNTGPFTNVAMWYWSNTLDSDFPAAALDFFTYQGVQSSHEGFKVALSAWAVRDGDVASVPEPGTIALLGIALAGLGFSKRKFVPIKAKSF